MGQYLSSSRANSTSQNCTPQRLPNCVDPRSPTKDIDRTPIQINGSISDENSSSSPLQKADEKVKRRSLRQKMFDKKKNVQND